MSTSHTLAPETNRAAPLSLAQRPLVAMLLVIAAAWSLAALAPIGFSIATVFLFAGPHNWLEARYMLKRMPARWGPLWPYFTLGIGGTVLLAGGLIAIGVLPRVISTLSAETLYLWFALWSTLLVSWIVSLALIRSRQNPQRNWPLLVPGGLAVLAFAWQWPVLFGLAMVYLHPLMSLWFLDRELTRSRSSWRSAYRAGLLVLPVALLGLWAVLASAPDLPGDDDLKLAITGHAGAGVLEGVSTHLLVSTHTFLEMLHYGVWIVAIPLVSIGHWPWQVDDVPLARRSTSWRRAVLGLVALGALVMVVLWVSFLANYGVTRDVYFLVATLHVLAEVPFLLRLL